MLTIIAITTFSPQCLITASHAGIMSMPQTKVHSNYIHSLGVVLVTLIKSNPDPGIFIQISSLSEPP